MVKRILAILLAAAMFVTLTACGGTPASENSGQDEKEETGQEDSADSGEVTQLSLWHYWDMVEQQELLAALVKDYEAQNPNIKINISYIPYAEYLQKILVSAAGGTLPDLFIYDGNNTAAYVESGILADITDKIEESGIMDNCFEGVVEEHKIAGRLYGFPVYANCLAFFYNTDVVKTPPTTLDELYETAKEVTTDEMYGFAMSGMSNEESSFQFLPFVWSANEDLDNIAREGSVKALDTLAKMIEEGYMSKDVINYTQQDVRMAFETGRAAMMINGPWNVNPIKENAPDLNWDLALIPKSEGGEYASILGGESFGVGTNANVDEIWGFVEYMMEKERYTEFLKGLGQLPADKVMAQDAYYQNDPVSKLFIEQLECARPRPVSAKYNEMSKALQTAIGSTFSGSATAEEALKEAAATITPLYEEFMENNQ